MAATSIRGIGGQDVHVPGARRRALELLGGTNRGGRRSYSIGSVVRQGIADQRGDDMAIGLDDNGVAIRKAARLALRAPAPYFPGALPRLRHVAEVERQALTGELTSSANAVASCGVAGRKGASNRIMRPALLRPGSRGWRRAGLRSDHCRAGQFRARTTMVAPGQHPRRRRIAPPPSAREMA